jgi:hypothetical protein
MQQHRDTGRLAGLFTPSQRSTAPRERTVQLVCNPADDDTFRAVAESVLASGVASPAGLQRLLEARYPRVVVRARGLSNEEFDAWYVYREGSWVRSGTVDPSRRT